MWRHFRIECELGRHGTFFLWATTPSLDEATAAASALTGLPPKRHGVDERGLSFLSDAQETLAERLAQAGYSTAAFVASPRLNRSRRLDQGFDHYADRAEALTAEEGAEEGHRTMRRRRSRVVRPNSEVTALRRTANRFVRGRQVCWSF